VLATLSRADMRGDYALYERRAVEVIRTLERGFSNSVGETPLPDARKTGGNPGGPGGIRIHDLCLRRTRHLYGLGRFWSGLAGFGVAETLV
jgi:hypothetical protein